jgi:hypothetical protein
MMKSFVLTSVILLLGITTISQPSKPKYLSLEYMVVPNGGIMKAALVVQGIYKDTSVKTWHIKDRERNLQRSKSGKQNYWYPRRGDEFFYIPDDRGLISLSAESFINLRDNGFVEFQGHHLTVISPKGCVFDVNGRRFAALQAENNTGSIRIWVLDNARLPLLLKTEGNPYDADIELIDIHEL